MHSFLYLRWSVIGALCALLLAGCELLGLPSGGSNTDVVRASADDPFDIEVGQTAVLDDLDARIRFVALPEDSRCPKGLMCVWSGRVRASFELVQGRRTHAFTFEGYVGGADGGPSLQVDVADLNITLRAVSPYPVYDPDTGRSTRGRAAALLVTRD